MAPPIAIIGAGPSGLTLARLLEVAGVEYIIYERDESPHAAKNQGGSLDIHGDSGQLALREAGLLDQFKKLARYEALKTTIADARGNVALTFGGEEGGEEDRPEIDRKDLRALLLDSIPSSKVQWGATIQQVHRCADGSMGIHFTDGHREAGFHLVVGADGAWSKVRNMITSAKPKYSGRHFLAGSISPTNSFHPKVASLVGHGTYLAASEGKQIVAMRLGDASYCIYVGLALPEDWASESPLATDPSRLRQWLLDNVFADWANVNTDLIKHCDGDFRPWPLTPFVGEGVNCALTDSAQLAQQIIKYGMDNMSYAVREYEKLMFPRGISLITRSAQSGDLMFAPDAPRGFVDMFTSPDGI